MSAPRTILAVLVASSGSRLALAQTQSSALPGIGRAPVSLELSTCLDVRAEEVRRIVGIELNALLVGERAPDQNTTAVVVDCHSPYATIEVTDPITGKSVRRTIDLSESARIARPRLLGLSIVELVSASWTELATNPSPTTAPVGAVADAGARRAALEMVRARMPASTAFRLTAMGSVRAFLPQVVVWGGGVRFQADYAGPFGIAIDVILDAGTRNTPLGGTRFGTLSSSAMGSLRLPLHSWTLRLSAGARMGAAWLTGIPGRPGVAGGSINGLFGGPIIAATTSFVPTAAVSIEATLESGRVLWPVSGAIEGSSDVAVRGIWLGGMLGFSVAL